VRVESLSAIESELNPPRYALGEVTMNELGVCTAKSSIYSNAVSNQNTTGVCSTSARNELVRRHNVRAHHGTIRLDNGRDVYDKCFKVAELIDCWMKGGQTINFISEKGLLVYL